MKTILVPTDGSKYSKTAVEYGIYLATIFNAQLKGLCIIDTKIVQGPLFSDVSGFMGLTPSQDFLVSIEKGLDERAQSILDDFCRHCSSRNLSPSTEKATGLVDETIIEEGKGADLIVLAKKGEHYRITGSGLMGSTAESVVRKSGKPVLITPFRFQEIQGVGLAYDGSDPAHRALKLAAELLPESGWSLTTIMVSDEPSHLACLTEQVKSFLKVKGLESDLVTRSGKEEQELIGFLEEGSIQLMIMGAYGKSRLRELILGSTTSYVIRKSAVPVLMVR